MARGLQILSGNIVDVTARRIFHGTVSWCDGVIQHLRPSRDPAQRAGVPFIAPGFVDAHIHIESSLLPPAEFARLAVVHGTVATVSDPHEIANVLGAAGLRHMIAEGRGASLKFNFGAPSCVPATDRETAGAALDPRAVDRLLARPDVRYLSEFMNVPAVLARDPAALAKIASARRRGKPVDGHAPGLRGRDVTAYAAAGITTDHECTTLAEARDKIAAGLAILIREGSAARNFDALAPLLRTHPGRCMFCCDDLHPDLLAKHHIDAHVRRALALGVNRFDTLACASVNPVLHYGLDVGLLRAGDPADFIVFEGWRRLRVRRTYIAGALVARDGRSLLPRRPARIVNSFRARPRAAGDFVVPAQPGRVAVIEAVDGQLTTRARRLAPLRRDGAAVADTRRDILKLVVVNRYLPAAPPAVAFVRGFGLHSGALASSVAHDSHNIVAVGTDDESLTTAVNLVIRHRGALVAVGAGESNALPLPIAGLMSDLDGYEVAGAYARLDRFAKDALGSTLQAPFMTLSFMALLVIPELKLSDRGLFSSSTWDFVPLFDPGT